ncbi:hypothetical protein Vretifemale_14640 [Volvox reticuliferus]|uniref:Uncharacterized protein n=1 Tax=Volvox reticuliferus TaxID=1737510 RepID=A0A8J4CMT6_9CHLO|nr:hypothetical protein Vretifemale_14640 [Volvox reticuliferus]
MTMPPVTIASPLLRPSMNVRPDEVQGVRWCHRCRIIISWCLELAPGVVAAAVKVSIILPSSSSMGSTAAATTAVQLRDLWPISQGGRGVAAARGAGRVSYPGIGGAEASAYGAARPSAWLGIDALQCRHVDETAACNTANLAMVSRPPRFQRDKFKTPQRMKGPTPALAGASGGEGPSVTASSRNAIGLIAAAVVVSVRHAECHWQQT